MNPMTNVKNITKLNERELALGGRNKSSWHDMYKESAWIFVGGLSYDLTEGDVISVFSQYGEIVNINMVRDKKTGKTKGFCFLCYENQKSTILAVDNFNGIKLCGRVIRVDHVANYKPPKANDDDDNITKILHSEGCAPKLVESSEEESEKSRKKSKKGKRKRMKYRKDSDAESSSDSEKSNYLNMKIKKEKHDPGYEKYSYEKENPVREANQNYPERKRTHSKVLRTATGGRHSN